MPQQTAKPDFTKQHLSRMEKLRTLMHSYQNSAANNNINNINNNLDAVLLINPQNVRYYSGFAGGESWLLITGDRVFLLSDGRFIAQAAAEAPLAEFLCRTPECDIFALLIQTALGSNCRNIAFEGSALSYQEWYTLHKRLQNHAPGITLCDCGELANTPRLIKDEYEIACLRECARIEDSAIESILPIMRPGISEKEITWRLETAMRQLGGEGVAFSTIVASGENSAKPHAIPSDRLLQPGDFVTIDFGCRYHGYRGDCTRTFAIGEPSKEQRAAYQLVLDAQMTALSSVRPGMTTGEADSIARNIIAAAGMGEYFSHSLGHGVGLEIHEAPAVRQKGEHILTPGNIITIEPGVYLPGNFGLRIEDSCLVTDCGLEPLTHFTKELLILK